MSATYPSLQFTTFPDSINSFVTMLNMSIADGAAVTGYQQAMQAGNNTLAQQYYSQITNANQKFIDATKMNTLMDTCVALQKFYKSDIEPYIQSQQTIWGNRINQFNYVGDYSASKQYEINNFITYVINGDTRVFICTVRPPIGTAPTNNSYWRQLSLKGLQGPSGENLSFRYAWKSDEIYYVEDVVVYDNVVWGCLVQNSNQTPQSGSTYWQSIYSPQQVVYPFTTTEPTNMQEGYLWFKRKS